MMNTNNYLYYSDCRFFRGDAPCKHHKNEGIHCYNCHYYSKTDNKILIIKLGAIGDVIRTTPLLTKLWLEYPNTEIWWLTYSPEILPSKIDRILKFNSENLLTIQATDFDLVINLDKDPHACALTKIVNSKSKIGYILKNGKPSPINDKALPKFITGLFDDINQSNDKTYLQEIFEICGFKFEDEEYLLEFENSFNWDIENNNKKIIGLNTGCGARWVSRLWENKNWLELISILNDNGFFPILLGGEQENSNNQILAKESGAFYPGYFNLQKFISLMNQCDCVVSAVTMGMHIAIGLKKPLILMNNIFNLKEFELYGRGEIIQPELPCKCFFSPKCKNPEYFCMDSLKPISIFEAIKRNI